MITELYCRLYVNSVSDEATLLQKIAKYIGGNVAMRSVSDAIMHIRLSKNDTYLPNSISNRDEFVQYPYTAEVHPSHEIFEHIEPVEPGTYIDLVCEIITKLRQSGDLVVASCDYEDLIVEKTGWNWSEKTPRHPPFSQ